MALDPDTLASFEEDLAELIQNWFELEPIEARDVASESIATIVELIEDL
mgnify:CR=1 FL=1